MSARMDEFEAKLQDILNTPWDAQDARVVPKTQDVKQKDDAKRVEATYLYADLADSTLLSKKFKAEFAARVIRSYLRIAVDCIRAKGGHIRSFDGDRVMGIFIGDRRRNDAVEAALNIQWVVDKSLNPLIKARLEKQSLSWHVSQRCGIDDGSTFIVRGGARDNSDLVSIGSAPNIAAKLSSIRGESGNVTITSRIYNFLFDHNKTAKNGESMWKKRGESAVGPHIVTTYSSGWRRTP